jgi:adenylate cyclase
MAYLLALRRWYRFTREDNRQAQRLLERARVIRPDDPRVHALLASTHVTAFAFGWEATLDRLRQGRSSALRAIDLDPFSARAHASLAAANLWMGRDEEALATAQRAVELGPNSDLCLGVRAVVLAAGGRLREAIRSLGRALRLNPRYPSLYWTLLGHLHQAAGRQERAVAIWERVREASPDMIPPRLALIAHYDADGRHEEASTLAREILQINPALTADSAARLDPRSRSNPTALASLRARWRRAGIP